MALCQFLPGPASSQVGMALGLRRAGWAGALAAWLGFTPPSALALILFAFGVAEGSGLASSGAVHGLKVVAVAVVVQAVWGMARSLCPDRLRAGIAIGAALLVLALPTAAGQIGAIVLGGLVGRWALQLPHLAPASHQGDGIGRCTGALLLTVFAGLLVLLPLLAGDPASPWLSAVAVFYNAGALVFGGGHVVLPLLQAGAALYDPAWTSAIHSRADFALALAAFGLLVHARLSPVAALAAVAGWVMA